MRFSLRQLHGIHDAILRSRVDGHEAILGSRVNGHEAILGSRVDEAAFRCRMADSGRLGATGERETGASFGRAELHRHRPGSLPGKAQVMTLTSNIGASARLGSAAGEDVILRRTGRIRQSDRGLVLRSSAKAARIALVRNLAARIG